MTLHKMNRRSFLGLAAAGGLSIHTFAQAQKLRVGCQANALVARTGDFDSLLTILSTIASLGYAGFECNNHLIQSEFRKTEEAHRKIQATGLEFIGMHTSMAEAEKADLAAMAAGGRALDCRYIVMSGEGLSANGIFSLDAVKGKAEALNRYGRTVRAQGLALAYHNHTAEFANNNAEIQALAEHTDPALVSFLMDAGHGYQGGGDPATFMRRNSKRLVGVHVKTFKDKIDQVPLGQGDFGFEGLAAAICSTSWAGWIIDEEGGGKTADGAAVRPDRSYIRRIFGA